MCLLSRQDKRPETEGCIDVLRTKATDTSGETLAEVLMAILIAVLGATLLAMMVSAAMNSTSKSTAALDELYVSETALALKAEVESTRGGTATIDLGSTRELVDIVIYSDGDFTVYTEDR